MDWFDGVEAAVRDVPLDTLPLRPLLVLCRRVLAGFPILYSQGLICRILSDDLGGNIAKVEGALAEMERLAVAERASQAGGGSGGGGGASSGSDPAAASAGAGGGGGDGAAPPPPPPHSPTGSLRSVSSSPGLGYAPAAGPWFSDLTDWAPQPAAGGVFGARWIVRVLRFVTLLLSKVGADPAISISLAGRQTYTAIIAPFHAPVMGFVVKCVLYWAPTRAWVLKNTLHGATNEAACAACLRVAAALGPLAQACHAHLESRQLNYADLISAVPGGF